MYVSVCLCACVCACVCVWVQKGMKVCACVHHAMTSYNILYTGAGTVELGGLQPQAAYS